VARFRRGACWVVLGLIVGAPAGADGLKVEPGEWEFTSQTNLPNMPGNGPVVRRECVKESSFSPDDFQKDMQGGCTISDVRTTSSSMNWKLSCPGMPGGMTGEGRFESTGKTITGAMDMNMTVNGQPMNMQVRWNGKRIGPCKP
jgi:hypothetical protein